MPLPNQYCRLRTVYQGPVSRQAEIITWYRPQGATLISAPGFASGFLGQFNTNVMPALRAATTSEVTLLGTAGTFYSSGVFYTGQSRVGGGTGANNTDTEPFEVAVLFRKSANTPGRSGHGKWFVPFVPETFTDDDYLATPTPVAIPAVATALLMTVTDPNGVIWEPCHYSRATDTLNPIQSVDYSTHLAQQERRRVQVLFFT